MIAFPDSTSPLLRAPSDFLSSSAVLEDVNRFAERLDELPAQAWIEVGSSLLRDRSGSARRATAFAVLDATLNGCGLAVAAWYACDAIETAAFYASRASDWTSSDRRAFAAARAAAEDAALAILARRFVPATECATLVEPFESLVREAVRAT